MTGSGGYLRPLWVGAFMACLAGSVLNHRMCFYPFIPAQGKRSHQSGAFEHALLVTAMAGDLLMFAGCPSVPGLLHQMARTAKIGVLLGVVIETEELVAAENNNKKKDYPGWY